MALCRAGVVLHEQLVDQAHEILTILGARQRHLGGGGTVLDKLLDLDLASHCGLLEELDQVIGKATAMDLGLHCHFFDHEVHDFVGVEGFLLLAQSLLVVTASSSPEVVLDVLQVRVGRFALARLELQYE